MKPDALTRQPAEGGFGGRFYLVSYLPTYAAALFLLVLIWAGARGWAPYQRISFKAAWATASHLGAAEIVLLVLAITLLAVVVHPLQLAMTRVAEGTWPPWLGAACARRWQRRRKARLLRAAQLPTGPASTDEAAVQRAGAAGDLLRRRFPMPDHLLRPTALGNVLAAMDDTAGRAYGLDAVIAWPRLYPVLGDQVKSLVDDRRDALDTSVRMTATMTVTALLALVLLQRSGWWMLLGVMPLAVATLAYSAAVQGALAYAETVQAAFDLHHADLLTALRIQPPTQPEAERILNEQWCDHWRQGVPLPPNLDYTASGKESPSR